MAIDWSNLYKKYKGKWLALKKDEKTVIGVGNTAIQAFNKAKDSGYDNQILTKIPTKLLPYVGSGNHFEFRHI